METSFHPEAGLIVPLSGLWRSGCPPWDGRMLRSHGCSLGNLIIGAAVQEGLAWRVPNTQTQWSNLSYNKCPWNSRSSANLVQLGQCTNILSCRNTAWFTIRLLDSYWFLWKPSATNYFLLWRFSNDCFVSALLTVSGWAGLRDCLTVVRLSRTCIVLDADTDALHNEQSQTLLIVHALPRNVRSPSS